MEYSRGDLWDRWTIERRKQTYGAENDAAVAALESAIEQMYGEKNVSPGEVFFIAELAMANDSIAVLEWQIRADHKLSDEEVGIRAREIRKINARRVHAKKFLDRDLPAKFTPAFDIDLSKVNLAVPDVAK